MRISDWSSDVCSSDLRKSVIANPPNPGPRSHRAKSRCPEGQRHSDGCLDDARYERDERSRQDLRPQSQRPPGILRDPAIRLAVDPRLASYLGEVADAGHVIGEFMDDDDAERLEELEEVDSLASLLLVRGRGISHDR